MSHQHPLNRPPRRLRRLALSLRRNRGLTTRLLLLAILFPVLLWLFTSSVAARTSFGLPDSLLHSPQQQNPGAVQNVLLVTAHPDDEALFFGPTVLQLTRRHPNIRVSLLVMSAGKFGGRIPFLTRLLPTPAKVSTRASFYELHTASHSDQSDRKHSAITLELNRSQSLTTKSHLDTLRPRRVTSHRSNEIPCNTEQSFCIALPWGRPDSQIWVIYGPENLLHEFRRPVMKSTIASSCAEKNPPVMPRRNMFSTHCN